MAGIKQVSFASPYDAEELEIERRRRMAESLQQQGQQGMGGTDVVGGWAIPKSPWEGLSRAVQTGAGAYQEKAAVDMARKLRERQMADTTSDFSAMAAALRGRAAVPADDEERMLGVGPGSPGAAAVPAGQMDPAMLSQLRTPQAQQMAMSMLLQQMQPKKPVVVGRSLLAPDTGEVLGVDQTWKAEQEAARAAKEQELRMRLEDARTSREERAALQRQLAEMQIAGRREMAGIAAGLRQPPAPHVIQTAQGPMVLGPNNQAIPITDAQGNAVKPASGRGGPMTATAQKELIETEEQMQGGQAALDLFKQAKAINDKAMGFAGAGAVASAGTLLPGFMRPDTVDATQNLDNILQTAALPQLKAIFGGMPTEGERKILLDVQGSSSKPASVRKKIFDRAEKAIQARIEFAGEKAKRLREGTYFSGDGLPSIQPAANPQDAEALQWAKANPTDPRSTAILQKLGVK